MACVARVAEIGTLSPEIDTSKGVTACRSKPTTPIPAAASALTRLPVIRVRAFPAWALSVADYFFALLLVLISPTVGCVVRLDRRQCARCEAAADIAGKI